MGLLHRLRDGRTALAAFAALALALMSAPAPARAQFLDEALQANDLSPDAISRSPRMVGMGRLSLVFDDVHHRYDLWEFGANPAGLLDADSVSTLEFYPGTASESSVHDDPAGAGFERQDLGLRSMSVGYEAWRRQSGSTAFGVMGDFSRLRTDVPQTLTSEQRTQFNVPNTMLVLSGKTSFLSPERFRYGLVIHHRYQSRDDVFRGDVVNAAGQYIDKDGLTLNPPVLFTPDQYSVRSLGGTIGAAYRVANWLHVAADYDYLGNQIDGQNNGFRYAFELRESRPTSTVNGEAVGALGGLRYGVSASHVSTGPNEQRWVATISNGSGQIPLTGRGKYADRKESSNAIRGRATWSWHALTLAAGGSHVSRTVDTTVPTPGDPQSFNTFIDALSTAPGADSLALPDSVQTNGLEERATEMGGGAAYQLPWRHAAIGVEVHAARDRFTQSVAGAGPNPKEWDVRSGLEFTTTPALVLRGGYIYQHLDRDELTAQNEYLSHTVTVGFGLHPVRTSWTIETGYGITWTRADFGDPSRSRSNEQRGLARVRWIF